MEIESGDEASPSASPKRTDQRAKLVSIWLAGALSLLLIYNLTVWAPAAAALSEDDRNSVTGIHVHRSWLIHPRDITVDLVTVSDEVATIDLMRQLFQVAGALKGRSFGEVTLARAGKPVFQLSGADFQALGEAYDAGENPVYLVRTLPEKLLLPNGTPAFDTWTGGWLGVLGQQLEDVNAFGPAWASGEPPSTSVTY